MAQKGTAQLLTDLTNNIGSNGSNAITGNIMNTFLRDFVESVVNKLTDTPDLATSSYRSGSKALTNTTNIVVTFSSGIGTTNYKVFISDPAGVWTGVIHAKTATTFEIDGSGVGTIEFLAIIDN